MPLDIRKRGLAVAAVTALALAGLTVSPASAQGPVDEDGIVLLTPYGADTPLSFRSTNPRYNGRPVRLVAEVADPTATVTFDYSTDPDSDPESTWTTIGESSVDGGFASTSWSIPDGFDETVVALRVTSAPADAAEPPVSTIRREVALEGVEQADETTPDSVEIDTELAGFFPQPYVSDSRTAQLMSVTGETSATDGTVQLSRWRSSDGTFVGATDADVVPEFNKASTYEAAYDLGGAGVDGGTVALRAERGTDAVVPVTLVEQTIDDISVSADPAPEGGGSANVTVEVTDQVGGPVIGAQVYRSVNNAAAPELIGYTGIDGAVTTTQPAGSSAVYWANTTDDPFREPEIDPDESVTPGTYVQEARSIDPYFADGRLFDPDEFELGDVALDVLDQRNRPIIGSETEIEYAVTDSGFEDPTAWETGVTDAEGRVALDPRSIPVDGGAWLNFRFPPPEPTEEDPDPSSSFEGGTGFTVGEAVLSLDPAAETVRAPSGAAVDYTGTLMIGDEPLVGRAIDLEYVRGVENVPGRRADAGIVTEAGRVLTQQVTTDEDGGFLVRLKDTAEKSRPAELGGSLLVATGDTVASEGSTLAGNADESTESGVDFGSGRGEVTLRRGGSGNGRGADVLFVRGPGSVGGETIRVFRLDGDRRVRVAERALNTVGDANGIRVADLNDGRVSTYVVALVPSDRVKAAETRRLRLR